MKRWILLFITVTGLHFAACKNDDLQKKAENHFKPDNKKVTKSTSADTANASENNVTFKLLQGKWQSVEDKSDFLVFDKNHRREIAGGMDKWDDELFILSDHCLNQSNSDTTEAKEKDKYISCKASDLCWYISLLDTTYLTLTYLGRGNELAYKRVKK